jgi:BirA family biotin operon repressor/biotin-[acetyl-CoA-carboxylase] ligase
MSDSNNLEVSSVRQILLLLADGNFHSGEELGLLLGVSRAAIWKHLQKLEGLGVKLVSIKGRGYCVEGGLDLLDFDSIASQLDSSLPLKLHLFPHIDSTNSYLMRHESPALNVCLAESQSAGRGRRGRAWVSPFAQNIYCSIGWGFDGGVAVLGGLSLVVGLVVVRTLQRFGVTGLELKWPNDVLYQDRKLAGVLIEMTGDPAGYCQVVIGVGINVDMADDASLTITQPWIDLREIVDQQKLSRISRNELAAALIDELVKVLSDYEQQGFASYCAEWESFNAHTGYMVELINGSNISSGVCLGVNEIGALVLETSTGKETFQGGEISLRRR